MTLSSMPLSYCTNVHPGRNLEEINEGLNSCTAVVRRKLDAPLAAGLWLARSAVTEILSHPESLESLAQTLWQNDLCCYTLNAFPFGDFHTKRVKERVYLPDWASPERLKYTKDCASILAQLLPAGSEGSISTVPLGGRMNPTGPDFHAVCLANLIRMARYLKNLHDETGRLIRLAVEPEPMCEMSSIPQTVVPLFTTLFQLAEARGLCDVVQQHIGLCFDVCHQAVEFEDVVASIDLLEANEIRLNKIHITNALELLNPADNEEGRRALIEYVEPRYLHQTYARFSDGRIASRPDLLVDDICHDPPDSFLQADAWRIHFHVPVYAAQLGPLNTTRSDLLAALRRVATLPYAPHLEVETYTWPVMPGDATSTDLPDRIHHELSSTLSTLAEI